ncbi:MAG: tyrosine-type recombinase/integrase [Bacteroidetes bacterium]|jgi:integrase/recombinase XerD|nr:tyrosine-type recombinase/integrase [Bacteroidota bacterium]
MPSDPSSRAGDNAEDTNEPEAGNQLPAPAQQAQPTVSQGVPSQADDDEHLIELWLHGKSPNTQEAYERDLFQFIDFVDLPLRHVRLGDLQDWADHLEEKGLAPATRSRKLGTVKSLFSFGHRIGYLIYNVGAAISGPKVPNRLAERILPEEKLQRIIALESDLRNHALLRLFYVSGGRVSEVAGLYWRALQERRATEGKITGQVTFQGKGEKTRSVLLTPSTWDVLVALSHEEMGAGFGAPDDAVFRSQKTNGPLSRSQLWRIVRKATRNAGIKEDVSPHWFRHAHASHALDRGAPAHLVQQTLGHQSLATTSRYTHARPDDSSVQYLGI